MKPTFGPWSTAMNSDTTPQLSAFWKRRLALLPLLGNSDAVLSRRDVLRLAGTGLAVGALPLLRSRRPATAQPPDVSPGRIVFIRNARLASIRPDGSEFKYLSPNDLKPEEFPNVSHLSPDGKRIAFGTRPFPQTQSPKETYLQVHIRNLGEPTAFDLQIKGMWFCWSPDGKALAVAFADYDAGAFKNFIVDVATANPSRGYFVAGPGFMFIRRDGG